jgi:DNA helicase TIP49 (TBP-interacting protein)
MKESTNPIDDEVRKRIRDQKERVKKESNGVFIKFQDRETKILEFIEPYEGEVVPVTYRQGEDPQQKRNFYAFQIVNGKRTSDIPLPWTVGKKLTLQLYDCFMDGDTILEIKRNGATGDKGTTYRMQRPRMQLA